MTRHSAAFVIAACLAASAHAADDCPDWQANTLSGGWHGTRSNWCEQGVTVDITHKSDLIANVSGGVANGSVWLMNTEAAVSLDLDKLAAWDGASAFLQYHVQHGANSINNYTGSYAGVDNIETAARTGQFFQAWLQKNFAGDSLSILGGLYAIDSEFYLTDSSGLFLQPPYGMSSELAQTGRNGPPIFPMGALGMRVKYNAADFYVQTALTDGVPGNPDNPHGTQIRLDSGDGTLAAAEFGYTPQLGNARALNKTALGLWRYSARASDLTETDAQGNPLSRADQGLYFLAERSLTSEQRDSGQGLSGFLRIGLANRHAYQSDWSGSMGLNYLGWFDGRDEDAVGIALATIHASAKYRQSNASDAAETVFEITYRTQLTPWLALQPDMQLVHNPNMDPALKDAHLVGVRLEIAL